MPRPSRFTTEDVLDAALSAIAQGNREVTIAMIAAALDGTVGSIYHRFDSRDEILVRLWMRSIRRFQEGIFAAADEEATPYDALLACARHIPRYCDQNRAEAVALTLFRQEHLLTTLAPGALRDEVATLNDAVFALLTRLAREHFGDRDDALARADLAVRGIPYGIVRSLVGGAISPLIEPAILAATRSVLELSEP